MSRECIRYSDGYKYRLEVAYRVQTGICPPHNLVTAWCSLDTEGWLTICAGYAWDGASGPTLDTPASMRPSLVHDALYQLMRLRLLNHKVYRASADALFYRQLIEDGMLEFRAKYWYAGVSTFGDPHADPELISPDKCAPCDCELDQGNPDRSAERQA